MNKIIAAIDGLKPSTSTATYAIELARQNKAHLVGVFLDDFTYTSYKIYDLVTAEGGVIGSAKRKFDHKDLKTRMQAAATFEANCQKAGISYTIHHDKGYALQDLVRESIFADLLLIDARETLEHYPQKTPTDFIKDLLSKAHCPILIVPHVHKPIQKLVFLYDGEAACVHALKQFHYVISGMALYKMKVVFVNWTGIGNHIPDDHLLKEWMKKHHEMTEYIVLPGDPEKEMMNFLHHQTETSLLILGAYHRSRLSRWFKPSVADKLMSDLRLPLFIAP
ncbi:MAG: universal stress protein [Chitinophagaceae bacterium]|nr:MAG: universal stress protein [Chitinophagaceae bacterium]